MESVARNSATVSNQHPSPRGERRPFIINIAPRATAHLSQRASKLWLAILPRADGHTGELKLPRAWNHSEEYWFKGTDIDRWARMSKPTRLLAMRELIEAGLVTMVQPRIHRVLQGRHRAVAGHTQYTLHRRPVAPKHCEKATNSSKVKVHSGLQKSNSSAVKEIDQEVFQTTPSCAGGPVSVSPSDLPGGQRSHHHHHHTTADDDEVSPPPIQKQVKNSPNPSVDEKIKSMSPCLRAWMDAQILKRAQDPVRSAGAYLTASRPRFLEKLPEEIELFLLHKGADFMSRRIEVASVTYGEFCTCIEKCITLHSLPISGCKNHLMSRIWENASELLGLEDSED